MLKVIIADDEPKVCQLILKLIDWDELNMEVVVVSHDGKTAFQEICEKRPDIVISDIRMPTYDGIELIRRTKEVLNNVNFIIVSGFSQFEYAQQAIKYGVDDYLLKPIKKAELRKALEKIREKHRLMDFNEIEQTNLKRAFTSSAKKAKKNLIWDILNNPGSVAWGRPISEINEEYCCRFIGPLSAAIIRPYSNSDNYNNDLHHMLLSKLQLLVEKRLNECCSEVITTIWDDGIVCFMDNYNRSHAEIDSFLLKSIRDTITLKDIFQNFAIVIGVGQAVYTIKDILLSYNSAQAAIKDRMIFPSRSIIHSDNQYPIAPEFTCNSAMCDMIVSHFEHLNFSGVLKEIQNIRQSLVPINGNDAYDCYRKIVETVYYSTKNYFPDFILPDMSFFLNKYSFMLKLGDIFDWLCSELQKDFDRYLEDKESKESKPIFSAKQYISQNYWSALSLETVSMAVGFNPAYFSSLFKKETGKNFLEFVTETRINAAKSILVKTDMDIADVAAHVGYTDIKYFSGLFKKITGLSPREYRRLYG